MAGPITQRIWQKLTGLDIVQAEFSSQGLTDVNGKSEPYTTRYYKNEVTGVNQNFTFTHVERKVAATDYNNPELIGALGNGSITSYNVSISNRGYSSDLPDLNSHLSINFSNGRETGTISVRGADGKQQSINIAPEELKRLSGMVDKALGNEGGKLSGADLDAITTEARVVVDKALTLQPITRFPGGYLGGKPEVSVSNKDALLEPRGNDAGVYVSANPDSVTNGKLKDWEVILRETGVREQLNSSVIRPSKEAGTLCVELPNGVSVKVSDADSRLSDQVNKVLGNPNQTSVKLADVNTIANMAEADVVEALNTPAQSKANACTSRK